MSRDHMDFSDLVTSGTVVDAAELATYRSLIDADDVNTFTARLEATLGSVQSDSQAYALRAEATTRYLWQRVRAFRREYSVLHKEMTHAQMRHAHVHRQLLQAQGGREASEAQLKDALAEVGRLQSCLSDFQSLNTEQGRVAAAIRFEESTKWQDRFDRMQTKNDELMSMIMAMQSRDRISPGQAETPTRLHSTALDFAGPERHPLSLVERLRKVTRFQSFSGVPERGQTHCNLQRWLDDLELQAGALEPDRNKWVPLFGAYLTDKAKGVLLRLDAEQRKDYTTIVAALKEAYQPEFDKNTAHDAFLDCEQADSSVYDFYEKLCDLATTAGTRLSRDSVQYWEQVATQLRRRCRPELRQKIFEAGGMLTATHKELLQFLMQLESASKLGRMTPSATRDSIKTSGGAQSTQSGGQSSHSGVHQEKAAGKSAPVDDTADRHTCGAQAGMHTITKACVDFVQEARRNQYRGGRNGGRGGYFRYNGYRPPVSTDSTSAQATASAPVTGANTQPIGHGAKCYNCGQEGHYSMKCPRRTGSNALTIGAAGAHVVADSGSKNDYRQSELPKRVHELLYAPLQLGVTEERAMIDSGAECNSIEQDVLKKVCAENGFPVRMLSTVVKELTVFGGGRAPVLGCVELRVKCGGNVATLSFMVFKGSGFPVLLGLPGLSALGFRLNMPNSSINMLPLTDRQGAMNVVTDSEILLQPHALMCVRLDVSRVQTAAKDCTTTLAGLHKDGRVGGTNGKRDVADMSVTDSASTCAHPTVYVFKQEPALAECGAVLDNSVHDAVHGSGSVPLHLRNVHGDCTVISEGTLLGTIRLASEQDVQRVESLTTTQLHEEDFICVDESSIGQVRATVRAAALLPAPTTDKRKDYVRANMHPPEQLTAEQAAQLQELIVQYSDAFSMGLHDLPPLLVEPMTIRLKPGTTPIRQKLRKEPLAAKDFVREQIMQLVDGGIVRPSRSPWLQPITVATKKSPDKFRLCVDFRLVNEATLTECMRMPSIDVLQYGLAGKPYISAIDLTNAYHQLPLHTDSIPITAFGCSAGSFEYNRVPFGLRNAPFEYQRTLETVLASLICPSPARPGCYVANYIDDIVIGTETFEQHLEVLEDFFKICLSKNLRVSIKKSMFGMKEVLYLGWCCSASGVRPNPDKVRSIKDFPPPTDVKSLRSFLGMVNFYHKVCAGLATASTPLRRLLSPKHRFEWTTECQQAFEDVKNLVVDMVLAHPRPGEDFYMQTDASDYGIGAVLEQYDEEGILRPIAFFSMPLNEHELKYSVSEKEAYAVVAALRHWQQYVAAAQWIHVTTDNSALCPIFNAPKQSHARRLTRWRDEVMAYNLKVTYRAGPLNAVADFLSRYPVQPTAPVVIQDGEIMSTGDIERVSADMMKFHGMAVCATRDDGQDERTLDFETCVECPHKKMIVEQQAKCVDCIQIRDCMAQKAESDFRSPLLEYARTCNDVCGVLVRPRRTEPHSYVPVVPKGLRSALVQAMHAGRGTGHLRWPKLFWLIADRYDWPGMQSDIKKHLAACQVCLLDYPGHTQKADCAPFVTLSRFHRWSMDVVDLGHSPSDFRLAVVFVEYFTKFPVAVPIIAYTGRHILTALMNYVVSYFGVPAEVVADAHSTHTSKDFAEPCKQMGISLNLSRGYSHTHVGQSERYIRTVLAMLRRSAEDSRDWVETLPLVLLHYRAAKHPGTGYSPAYLMFAEDIRLPCEQILDFRSTRYKVDVDSTVQAMADCLAVANKVVLETNKEYRAKMVEDYRREHHKLPSSVGVGDQVYVSRKEVMNRHGRVKLDYRRYRGPYNVIDASQNLPILTICDPVSGATETINKRFVVKSDRQLNVPHVPARRRKPQARVAVQHPAADFARNLHDDSFSNAGIRLNSLFFSGAHSLNMSNTDLMDFDEVLDTAPTEKITFEEEAAALDLLPSAEAVASTVTTRRSMSSTIPSETESTRTRVHKVDSQVVPHESVMKRLGRSDPRDTRKGFHGRDAREVLKRARSRDNRSRSRHYRHSRGFPNTNGYESGDHVSPADRRVEPTASSSGVHRQSKTDEQGLRRMMDSKVQSFMNDGGTVLSGKMLFMQELITTPVHAYAGMAESTQGRGLLPVRAEAPLQSGVMAALVRASGTRYSEMYIKYIEDFCSFDREKYKRLKWNGQDIKGFSRVEQESIRQYRSAVFDVFEGRCGVAAWSHGKGKTADDHITGLRRRIADGIRVLQSLFKNDPLIGIVGAGFHLNDSYFRTLQRPERQPSPFQFGKCFFTDCPTDAVHITARCPGLDALLGRLQPLKSVDDDGQAWDAAANTAIVDSYIRCALAQLMPALPKESSK